MMAQLDLKMVQNLTAQEDLKLLVVGRLKVDVGKT